MSHAIEKYGSGTAALRGPAVTDQREVCLSTFSLYVLAFLRSRCISTVHRSVCSFPCSGSYSFASIHSNIRRPDRNDEISFVHSTFESSHIRTGRADSHGHGSRKAWFDLHDGPASGDIGHRTKPDYSRDNHARPNDYLGRASDTPSSVHRCCISEWRRWLRQLWQ